MDSSRSRRWIFQRLGGVVLLATVFGLLAGCALPDNPFNPKIVSYPPPPPFIWNRVSPPPATPQQAYAAGMSQLRTCFNEPARATTTTWLVAGPTYGVALVRGDCSNDPQDQRQSIAILPIALDKAAQPRCPAWVLESSSFSTQLAAGTDLGQNAYQIPSWLPLPADSYEPGSMGGGVVPSAWFSLQSSTRLFITGRYEGSATRPEHAETVSVGGRTGWQVSENGMTTVTVPLADDWTFFFGGTADVAIMQRLASASLPHLDTLLPKPLPLPANYPQPTPAC